MEFQVKPVPGAGEQATDYPLSQIFDRQYAPLFGIAFPNSGKSTLAYQLLDWATKDKAFAKQLKVVIFCGTAQFEQTDIYTLLVKMLKERGAEVIVHECIFERVPDPNKPSKLITINHLANELEEAGAESIALKEYQEVTSKKQPKTKVSKRNPMLSVQEIFDDVKKASSSAYSVPDKPDTKERIFIFDDLEEKELQDPNLVKLVKKARHYRIRPLIFSQRYFDTEKSLRDNLGYIILFPKIDRFTVQRFVRDSNMPGIDKDRLPDLYEKVTATPHTFLFYSRYSNTLRKNFEPEDLFTDLRINKSASK